MGNLKKNNYPLIEGLEITSIAAEGKAMGRWNDVVVFVPMAVPGDVVDVQIRVKRRRFMEGYVVRYVHRSEHRAEPFCEHFGLCGGCKWQNLPYDDQLRFKQQQVIDQLTRIGHLELPEVNPILGSERRIFYRNKLEYTFAPRRWKTYDEIASGKVIEDEPALGFHIPDSFDKILDIHKCWLQDEPSNLIRLELKRYCVEHQIPFYDIRTHEGMMRGVIIRTSTTDEVMAAVIFALDDKSIIEPVMRNLQEQFPQITSLVYIVNTKLNDSISDLPVALFAGNPYITEQMEGLQFRIGAKSFYQTNSEQAYELYKTVRTFASLTGSEVVYDLYTGTGTIANFVAHHAGKVVGIEYVPEAIEDAKINSALNRIDNTVFYAGDMKDVLNDRFVERNGRPDVVILDPPRAGVHEDVIATILRTSPELIVYVSCNPATQARDLSLLATEYRITDVQPVDMFPHTHHVENVVRLVRSKPTDATTTL